MNKLQKKLVMEAKKHVKSDFIYAAELLEEALAENWISQLPSGFLDGSLIKDDVFHGSNHKFKGGDKLRPDLGSDYGIYFSTRRNYAKRYGRYLYRCLINIQNPIVVKSRGEIPVVKGRDLTKKDVDALISKGYDSIVVTPSTVDKAEEIIVFDPNKVFIGSTTSF